MTSASTPPLTKASSHSNLQIVPISTSDAAPPPPSGCWETFKRVICCCFPVAQQHHPVDPPIAQISSKHLVENYGELIAQTAQLLTRVDLKRKGADSILPANESKALADTAAFIQSHINDLKTMVQHVRYYNEALHPQSESDGGDQLVASPPLQLDVAIPEFKETQVDIIKRNGQIEKFTEYKIVAGLQKAPFLHPLSEGQIGEIVARVKQEIALLQTGGINTAFIRSIVNQETLRLGAQVAPPSFLTHISKAEIIEHLQQVKGIEQLSPEDCAALVQLIPGYSDINEAADLAHSDSSSVD